MSRKIRYALIYLFLAIAAFISVFPFYWMVVGSTNTSLDVNKGKLTFGNQFFVNIQNLITNFDLGRVFWNSIQISFFVVILSVVASSMAGYGFEMYKSKGMKYIYGGTLLTLMVPFAALMVPVFRLMTYLNLIDSLWGVILPMIPSVFLIFFFKQNFQTYPREIIMAARVDGASELRIFFSIVMPSMKATYAAAAIYSFLTSWNAYLQPLVIIQSQEKRTMALFIANLASGYQPDFGLVMTAVVVATVPALILFFMLQRYFVQGVLGSVKQ
ncbi:binding-protein-dependent transport systems inner membrane component [Petrotoga mobilis SJ95]|jgi:lactose/L-arabinose transport system permease protein|uniref:Binding-protein-dependent transport systems inner membrane component n=1 Tax=Petrotoga mobilis (strain DSM 10674 / SJ95) TaxID=403833 RepID=A9BHE1_PETMO|nr:MULTISPECIES: carbohydrate ABC transporter permease [Petrotoga]ABX31550.1 binding-protein-dependent transport systems inner membrane component [Petrotoga mobilis SJ95]MBL5982139.1 lactose ABC transporter permease [Petrotoga sp. 8T1HF07.NaAc.6.1]PNR89775.1 lactose ABC transporter permease [Petrotoga sp. 9T1HF07.CasAA.8.2]RLL84484.1 lactose ABC transporter permease [Petrotoga sp. Shatin.DS.tank11.9.2.9.3]RLL89613.1 lactose ABC transporter permease [Petrotoga sp. HKA.pet.4.5]